MEIPILRIKFYGGEIVTVKQRMERLGISQVDMIFELRKRGADIQPPQMSSILNGLYTYPKAKRILALCEEILEEREKDGLVYRAGQ